MYLKSIEVQGFKSFANKIVFDFHNGVTGIVGPNGSGKSNIADAVRWVLGEQKVKQLRSTSMQDVIFAGTEKRKPLSFAYVAITFDNTDHQLPLDYNEVTVARRVYRSGESEYLLNNVPCRLRDINEMLYDTGIGKEGYSIIGQGQIDKILSGKPEERRELFDEAAGIVKFKRRKIATLKKLEDEQQNLVRINDIVSELERQVGPLQRQSEQAKIYLKKKEELKVCDVNLFLQEVDRIHADLKSVNEKFFIANSQQESTTYEFNQAKRDYEELDKSMEHSEEELNALSQSISNADLSREKLEGQINVLNEQINTIRLDEAHTKERLQTLEDEIARQQERRAEFVARRDEARMGLIDLNDKKRALMAELDETNAKRQACLDSIEAGKARILELINELSTLREKKKENDVLLKQEKLRRAELNKQLIEHETNDDDLSGQLKASEEAYDLAHEKLMKLNIKRINEEKNLTKYQNQVKEVMAVLEEKKQLYSRESSRLEALKNIAERYDGYGNSIKRVMEKKASVPGIHGVVADLITVDKKYETAIETALGGSIQNIVTEDEQTAKRMVAFLKENRFGRATFLPLTGITSSSNANLQKASGERGVIGTADELVKTKEEYRIVAEHLLGRTLVVDTIDNAIALQKKFKHSLRIVTVEGELLQPGGSITGGAFKNNSNLLGRNREIETIEKRLKAIQNEMDEANNRLEDVNMAYELLKEDIDELLESINDMALKENSLSLSTEHLREQYESVKNAGERIHADLADNAEKIEALGKEKYSFNDLFAKNEKEQADIADANAKSEEDAVGFGAECEALQEKINATALEEARQQEGTALIQENIDSIDADISVIKDDQSRVLNNANNSEAEIQARHDEISKINDQIEEAKALKADLLETQRKMSEGREEMYAKRTALVEKRESLNRDLAELDKEIYRLNDQRSKLEGAEDNYTNYMWTEYEITFHNAQGLRSEEEISTSQLKKQIAEIKSEIKKLGNVNVNAIEEYKEVAERYEFLKVQHDDLIKAEAQLQEIIAELDDGMRKQFNEKFADIQREFDSVFKELFGGGHGTLELTEDDILESGVNIIAQPPGKKLQNMMQLSGGEKALTAIALLFAIQNLKPSPFALLDEIEAALDDSNVDRFASYLHKLTANTQFIVITHRRGTMNAADRLYGITMQEKGVSTTVSVDLIEDKLDA